MKTQEILLKKPRAYCTFQGECDFKKPTTERDASTERIVCTWKGNCNQKQNLSLQRLMCDTTYDG